MANQEVYDVVIVGGSYAGLAAALSLGRSRRKTLVIDSGNPCNQTTPFSHNFLTRDGERPGEIALKGKKDVLEYPGISFLEGRAVRAEKNKFGFKLYTEEDEEFSAKKLLFTTGIIDILPEIEGFSACWGISVLHCPYCHGYEFSDAKTGVLGNGEKGYEQVKLISHWSGEITLYTNGKSTLSQDHEALLKNNNIRIEEKEIAAFEHVEGRIQDVVFKDNTKQGLKALYTSPEIRQKSDIPESLGCNLTDHGRLEVDLFQKTNVAGVYAAGDNSSLGRAVIQAVSAGSLAGIAINKELISEELVH